MFAKLIIQAYIRHAVFPSFSLSATTRLVRFSVSETSYYTQNIFTGKSVVYDALYAADRELLSILRWRAPRYAKRNTIAFVSYGRCNSGCRKILTGMTDTHLNRTYGNADGASLSCHRAKSKTPPKCGECFGKNPKSRDRLHFLYVPASLFLFRPKHSFQHVLYFLFLKYLTICLTIILYTLRFIKEFCVRQTVAEIHVF